MARFLKWNEMGWTNKEDTQEEEHVVTRPVEINVVHNEDWEYSLEFPKNLYAIPRNAGKVKEA